MLASSVQRQESLLKFLMSFKRKACYNFTTGMLLSQVRSSALSSLSPSPHFVEWRLRPWSLLRGGRSKLFHLIILLNKTTLRKEMKDLKNDKQTIENCKFCAFDKDNFLVLLIISLTKVLRHGIHQGQRLLLPPLGGRTRPYLANIGQIHLYLSETMERQVFVIPLRANKYNGHKPQHLLRDLKISFGTSEFHNVGLFLDIKFYSRIH